MISFKEFLKEYNHMWIVENEKVYLCNEYILSESIKPRVIDYGTDFNNKEWKSFNFDFHVTCFISSNEHKYVVFYRNGFIGFGAIEVDPESFKSIDDILEHRPFRQTNSYEATYIFNNVFYIITEAIRKFIPQELKFDGSNKYLSSTYDLMVKNKYFLEQIKFYGYDYIGITETEGRNFFTFRKIELK